VKVLLLGATGMLGRALARHLPARFATSAPSPRGGGLLAMPDVRQLTASIEATDPASIDAVLDEAAADVVINCIAVTPASSLHGDAAAMEAVNSVFPHQLAARVRARNGRLIHISTDGVFSGKRGGYRETDVPDPTDRYGVSKLAGEVSGPGCLTIRTSFFGRHPDGRGLLEWLIAHDGDSVDGYSDYVFSGVAAPVLAGVIADLVEQPLAGTLHVGGRPISKYELLARAADALRLNVRVRPVECGRVDRSLDSSRLNHVLARPLPSLDAMLQTV
jgi:dTDP-4-dehydrorhamnose reductase